MGIPWDGTGINWYGMGQINMSHGQPCLFSNRPQKVLKLTKWQTFNPSAWQPPQTSNQTYVRPPTSEDPLKLTFSGVLASLRSGDTGR